MTKVCPGCGSVAPSEARYCRHCGAALRTTASAGASAAAETVSPLANTVPLPESNITTSELVAPDELTRAAHAPEDLSDHGEITISVVRPDAARNTPTHNTADTGAGFAPAPPVVAVPPGAPESAQPAPTSSAASADGVSDAALAASSSASSAASASAPPASPSVPAQARAGARHERRAQRVWLVLGLLGGALLLGGGVAAGAWYFVRQWRAPVVATNANTPPADTPADARQQAQAKLAEAQSLLAAGQLIEATARLREAVALDPANAEAHRQLAQLLLESGARQTAIEELLAVTRLEPNDKDAWRQLAQAQFAEGQYAAAADSYSRLMSVSTEAATDDRLQLAYAEALRLAGRADEARALYRRLAASPLADVARASRQRLADQTALPADTAANALPKDANANASVSPLPTPASHTPASPLPAAPSPAPTAAANATLSPAEHYQRGVSLWPSNRAAAVNEFRAAAADGNPDAYYYLGLSFAEGRDPRTLGRAELVAALDYFQRARAGRFAAQARRYEEQLGQEFDRRRQQQ